MFEALKIVIAAAIQQINGSFATTLDLSLLPVVYYLVVCIY